MEIIVKSFKEFETAVLDKLNSGYKCLYDGMDECRMISKNGDLLTIKLKEVDCSDGAKTVELMLRSIKTGPIIKEQLLNESIFIICDTENEYRAEYAKLYRKGNQND